jgi:uncharacterized protein (TIGR02996 family)
VTLEGLLAAIQAEPEDDLAWLALADALEEAGDPRAEITRLVTYLRRTPRGQGRLEAEQRLQALLASGARPLMPTVTSSVGIKLVLIPPGTFQMGASAGEYGCEPHELPRHEVSITRAFYLGVTHVTQRQYQAVLGANPSTFVPGTSYPVRARSTAEFPVDGISWNMAIDYCRALTRLPEERAAGRVYRLPTEAEWEYACRAGTTTPFAFGTSLSSRQANFDGQYPYAATTGRYLNRTCKVGSYPPNAFGLHDMHGQLYEWAQDRFGADYYAHSPVEDPRGPTTGTRRVLRGGSWIDAGWMCRSASRSEREALHYVGLRVAMTLKPSRRRTTR